MATAGLQGVSFHQFAVLINVSLLWTQHEVMHLGWSGSPSRNVVVLMESTWNFIVDIANFGIFIQISLHLQFFHQSNKLILRP